MSSKKQAIKHQIIQLLLPHNIGMPEKAVIQSVDHKNANAIKTAIEEMIQIKDIQRQSSRLLLTPIARAEYSQLKAS